MSKKTTKKERIGEKRRANNGQMVEIIDYINCNNITVRFEDNTELTHRTYKAFKAGELKNPNVPIGDYKKKSKKAPENKIGETIRNKYGLLMAIVGYKNAHNVDIEFENGIILLKRSYFHFKNGDIKMPTIFPNGIRIIEFAYRKDDDWYYICSHNDWTENKILPIREICPEPIQTGKNQSERREIHGSLVNVTVTATNGMEITCIADNGSKDITVRFQDGAIKEHQRREYFLKGYIRHPDLPERVNKRSKKQHIGEIWPDKKGRNVKIIEYYSNSNVTIEYDDGVRLENKEYRAVKKGADLYTATRVGETAVARNGLKMKIIDDRIWHDVKIEFEDGVVVGGCTHAQFDAKAVKHPNYNAKNSKQIKERNGMEARMRNGLNVKIIGYRNASDIDIRFENGLIVKNRDWHSFSQCRIGMPHYVGGIYIKEFAYRIQDDWYYIVSKDDWNEDRIMSVQEMYAHEGVDYASIRKGICETKGE
jgi:hypothetical protein